MTTTEQGLRAEIQAQLKRVNSKNAPKINQTIQTPQGYHEIETKVILMVINDGITPSACIPQIESEL